MPATPPPPPPDHDDNPARRNINAIVELERSSREHEPWAARVSDRISRFAGSLSFVGIHFAGFVAWAVWNSAAPERLRFDPYPYGLLTFIVSLEGVLIATFVLIAQNRMVANQERRNHLHLQVALLTEQEITLVLQMIRRVAARLDVPPESEEADKAAKLGEETNVFELMQTIQSELPDDHKT